MHGIVCDIEKEVLLLVAINEGDRLLGNPRGEVNFFFDRLEAAIDGVIHVRVIKVGVCPAPHEAIELIEPSIHGVVFFREPEVPLTQCPGNITGRLEPLGNKHFIKRNTSTSLTGGIDSESLLVTTRHESGARRGTHVSTGVALRADDR